MSKTPEKTDWLSPTDQQYWFDKFCQHDVASGLPGLKFNRFQEFLSSTIYSYYTRPPNGNAQREKQDVRNDDDPGDQQQSKQLSYQQEMKLFKHFDSKNDHVLDSEEFGLLCQNLLDKIYRRACALIVVDVQNDFIDGSLALINGPASQDGVEVVPVINRLLSTCSFQAVAYTQDWHPINHIGFIDNLHLRKHTLKRDVAHEKAEESGDSDNSKLINNTEASSPCSRFKLKKLTTEAKLFDTVLFDEDGRIEQKMWPVHCVQNSWGAELHPKLTVVPNSIRVLKGTLANVDAYSAFWDNKRLNETGLRQELISRKINEVFFCGLALDYCVAASALDSAKAGFMTFVIEDACRGLDRKEMEVRRLEMLRSGISLVDSRMVEVYFSGNPLEFLQKKIQYILTPISA